MKTIKYNSVNHKVMANYFACLSMAAMERAKLKQNHCNTSYYGIVEARQKNIAEAKEWLKKAAFLRICAMIGHGGSEQTESGF